VTRDVLVADDSAAVRRLVSARLRRDGCEVRGVEDGLAALRLIDEQAPDVLVLDDVLPCLSGVEVIRALRMRPETRALTVVYLCAYAAGRRRARLVGLPAEAVIAKPLDLDELAAHVRSAAPWR
jgi:two-component system phosphate regulon response regulator PhoB